MANLSNYLANILLDYVKGGTGVTPPATTYFALMKTMPTASGGGVEVSGGSYARVAVTNNSSNWPASSGGSKTNANSINFGTATADWGTVVGVAEFDASSGGNLLTFSTLNGGPVTILNGTPYSIPAGSGQDFGVQLTNLSTYLADRMNDWFHGGGSYSVPATTYFSPMTTLPSAGGTGGVESAAFSRLAKTNNSTNWPAASGQTKSNGTSLDFGNASSNTSIVGIAEYDASSGGNVLTFGALSNAPFAAASGQDFQIPINGAVYQAA